MQTRSTSPKPPAAGRGCGRAVMASWGSSTGSAEGPTCTSPAWLMGGMDCPPMRMQRAQASSRGAWRH
eukprot:5922841-Lingulodinium_polyedra.AAC.1